VINDVIDGAIGIAVHSFAEYQVMEVQRRREDYLAFVSHDLKTPLNAITLATHVLDFQFSDSIANDETRKILMTLRRNVAYLSTLVSSVLDENSKTQSESGIRVYRRKFDLWPVVETLIRDMALIAKEGAATLVNNVPEDLVMFADAELLRRVFQNLIANAVRYTPTGTIEIGARVIAVQTGRSRSATVPGSSKAPEAVDEEQPQIECWVRDNGMGIPENQLATIFDKGVSDPEFPEGTGLGLAIVKAFIEAHGGTIRVESTSGQGAIFRFTLPLAVHDDPAQ
jgi:signal transduction histidine kinase